jgi:tRNA (mo5U34)-methyltransferase
VTALDQSAFVVRNAVPEPALHAALDEPWFHSFVFSNGVATPGRDPSGEKLSALELPDLAGKSVLDVGAYEGYFSFAAERMGAARVVASDDFAWRWHDSPALAHFRLVRELLGSSVEERMERAQDLRPEDGVFDVTLFLGVLYHAEDMVQYLRSLRAVTGQLAVIETFVDMLHVEQPCASLLLDVNSDATNWWGPNIPCVEGMLARVGFSDVRLVGVWHRNTLAQLRGEPTDGPLTNGRAVWHAYV